MNINYRKLAVVLLPTFLRRPTIISLLHAWMTPIQAAHDRLQAKREEHLYELHHTSQTCHIKAALNREFGISDYADGFEIEDINADGNWKMVYSEAVMDENNQFTNPTMVYDTGEILPPTEAFTVKVPDYHEKTAYDLARVDNIVNRYRLASRTFNKKPKQ